MSLILTRFVFDNRYADFQHEIRIYSDENGENSKVVLEDIASVLLTQPSAPAEIQQAIDTTEEIIKLAGITPTEYPTEYNTWHLATVDQVEEFYDYCDNLGDRGKPSVYESFGKWWIKVLRELIEKKIAHIGAMVTRIPTWQEEQAKTRRTFGKNSKQKISLRQWYKTYFKLNVEWIITTLIDKTKLPMSYTFKVNAGEKPLTLNSIENEGSKKLGGSNVFAPEDLVVIAPDVYLWLNKPKQLVEAALVNKNANKQAQEDLEKLEVLIHQGKTDDEILKDLWEVTPKSHLIEVEEQGKYRNYQYEILTELMEIIRRK